MRRWTSTGPKARRTGVLVESVTHRPACEAAMELKLRQPGSTGTVTNVHLRENGCTFDGELPLPTYPVLRYSMNLDGPLGGSGGPCHGTAAGSLNDGTFFSADFNGRWRRNGTTIICRHVVDVSNGHMNFDIAEWDMTGNTVKFAGYVLLEG